MILERLIVRKTKPHLETIRDVEFRAQGLNLILDETNNVKQNSGNSVGKTTAVKVIDLCLGAKSPSTLYKDQDTKAENTQIRDFLSSSKVEAELVLLMGTTRTSVVRALYPNGKRLIDDQELSEDEFHFELKKRLFSDTEKYPTFRQLMPRFIRLENQQLENMIKFLPMVSNDDLETIHLFLLNVNASKTLNDKVVTSNRLKQSKREYDLLLKIEHAPSLAFLKDKEKLIDSQIEELRKQRSKIDYIKTYKEELKKKEDITSRIDGVSIEIGAIEFDISLNQRSIGRLEKDRAAIDLEQIADLYRQAKSFLPNLQKTFEDIVEFHTQMINNKLSFVERNLEKLQSRREAAIRIRDSFIVTKQAISVELVDNGLLEDLNELNSKIDLLNVQKGATSSAIEKIGSAETEIQDYEQTFHQLEEKLGALSKDISNVIWKFNQGFSSFSKLLYNENYLFSYNDKWKELREPPFNCSNIDGNPGTGKKHAQIVAFDLAYIKLVKELGLEFPRFIIHDKLENTHINQLDTIFEMCAEIEGQFIVPILKERIDKVDPAILEESTVLVLSQDDKFFRI